MRLLVALVPLLMMLAGCADDDPAEDGPGDGADPGPDGTMDDTSMDEPQAPMVLEFAISAEGLYPLNPSLSPASFQVVNGSEVRVQYTNNDINPIITHDLFFSGVNVGSPVIGSGETVEVSFVVNLPPGDYPYWCAVGDHRAQGMEGVMTVVAS